MLTYPEAPTTNSLLRDYSVLPKKELHSSLWVRIQRKHGSAPRLSRSSARPWSRPRGSRVASRGVSKRSSNLGISLIPSRIFRWNSCWEVSMAFGLGYLIPRGCRQSEGSRSVFAYGCFHQSGAPLGSPNNKDHGILGSIIGPLIFWKFPCRGPQKRSQIITILIVGTPKKGP